jgi:predicted site-specific integrase-resolvase
MIQRSLFNVAEISLMTGVSVAELYREIERGRLKAPVINGRRRATREQIERWLGRSLSLPVAAE